MVTIKKKKKKKEQQKKNLLSELILYLWLYLEILAFLYTYHVNDSILHGYFPGSVCFPSNQTHALLHADGQGMAMGTE